MALRHLGPGGTVVEGTAGNTGIGLAHLVQCPGLQVRHLHAQHPITSEKSACGRSLRSEPLLCPISVCTVAGPYI